MKSLSFLLAALLLVQCGGSSDPALNPAVYDAAKARAGLPPGFTDWGNVASRVTVRRVIPEGLLCERYVPANALYRPPDLSAAMLIEGYKGPSPALGDVVEVKIYRDGNRLINGDPIQRWVTVRE